MREVGNYYAEILTPKKEGEVFRVKYMHRDEMPRVYISLLNYDPVTGDYKHTLFINKDSSSYTVIPKTEASPFIYNHFKKATIALYNEYLDESMKPLLSMDTIEDL